MKLVCLGTLFAISTAAMAGQSGFYVGVNGALDSGRLLLRESAEHNYLPVRGENGGLQLGWEWLQSPASASWQKGFAIEAAADKSNADYKRTDAIVTGLNLRSYRVKDDISISILPMIEKNAWQWFARLGWGSSELAHNESVSTDIDSIPNFVKHEDFWVVGLGMGHAISPHWRLQTEWDQMRYPAIGVISGTTTFTQTLKRSLWRLSLSWHQRATPIVKSNEIPGGWYGGLGVGQDRMSIERYFMDGSVSVNQNRAYAMDGPAAQLTLGRQWVRGQHMVFGVELSAAGMDSGVNVDAATGYSYKHDKTVALTLQPGWQFAPGQELFAAVGVGKVYVKKTGDAQVSKIIQPNFSRWQSAFIWGGGYRSMLTQHNALVLHFLYAQSRVLKQEEDVVDVKTRFVGPLFLLSWEYHL